MNSLDGSDELSKGMEEALRASEQKYRTLTENITVGIFRSTPGPTGRFLEVNPALVAMLGYSDKKELLAMDVSAIYCHPEDRLRFSEKISRDGFVRHEELMLRKRDGTQILVSETAIAIRSSIGTILFFDGIVEDITERKKAEEELLVQKTYLEQLFNSAPEAIVLHDLSDRVLNVNEEFTRMFGYARDEAIGHPINTLVAPPELWEEALHLSALVAQGERVERDSKRKRRDGTLIDVSILGAPIVHSGTQMGVYAIYRDITERKRAQEELLVQKTYLERLFNSALEAIVLHNNDDIIVNVNAEFTKMFGYTREEAIGKPINDLLASGEYLEEAVRISRQVIQGQKVELDTKRRRKDGSLVDVSILGSPIVHAGTQIGDYAIYRDITERKKAEEELRVQKTYLEQLFNSAPEAIVWHSNTDVVINVNEEFTRMFGYSREEAIGKGINDLVAPDHLQGEASSLSYRVIHGERVEVDSQRRRKDGTLVEVSILGAPIVHGGNQIGVYAIYRDITERKKAEEARLQLREEATTARNIQLNFLPKSNPAVPGYDITGRSIPAWNVGGDYYDFIPLDEHQIAIGLGDVSGKGLAASLVMANVQATIRGLVLFDADPVQCLERANRLLFRSTDARTFVSLFYAALDTRHHTLRYANAGQDPPIVFPFRGQATTLKTRGIALGLRETVSYQAGMLSLSPGDVLLVYSDGIVEAMNPQMEEFGVERLMEVVRRENGARSGELMNAIVAAIHTHLQGMPQSDDMTLIVLRREPTRV